MLYLHNPDRQTVSAHERSELSPMNEDLTKIIKLFATEEHSDVTEHLRNLPPDSVNEALLSLLIMYFNDKNSSTLREYILVTLSGFTPYAEKKIGYNGYRQVSIVGQQVRREECEAKPKNINTNDEKPKKLNGSGSFSDYRPSKFKRHKKQNPLMLVGGFVDGKLIYICRFPFNSPSFTKRLKDRLDKKFPGGEDIKNEWLRSASFRLPDYSGAPDLKVDVYLKSEKELDKYEKHLTKPLYDFLKPHLLRNLDENKK